MDSWDREVEGAIRRFLDTLVRVCERLIGYSSMVDQHKPRDMRRCSCVDIGEKILFRIYESLNVTFGLQSHADAPKRSLPITSSLSTMRPVPSGIEY